MLPDNLAAHTSVFGRRLAEDTGCALRVLPCSSPDCHSIDHAFAEVEQVLRWAAAEPAGDAVSPADVRGFFAAGYPLPAHLLAAPRSGSRSRSGSRG